MLKVEEKITIISLWKNGTSERQIARQLGISRTTVAKYLSKYHEQGEQIFGENSINRPFAAEPHRDLIVSWLEKEPKLSIQRIWEKLKEEQNYEYGYDSVRHFTRELKVSKDIYPVFEVTNPGEEAQVDFGYIGLIYDSVTRKKRKAHVFCMRLIYSRYDYYEVVFDQKVKTFLECHKNAFNHFGGVPENVKIDNLKAAILEANFYAPTYQQEYLRFSKHYGFNPHPCRPYKPKDKAHVENGIKYVKGNFFAGRSFRDKKDCNERLLLWMQEKSQRRHGTTRKQPLKVFNEEEKSSLLPLPIEPYEIYEWSFHKLHPDCYLRIDKNFYSAPHEHVGKTLNVRRTNIFVEIYDDKFNLICGHEKAIGCGIRVKNKAHFPEWVELISTGYHSYYMAQADKFGKDVVEYLENIFKNHKSSGYRMVQGILSLGKKYGKEQLTEACKRAAQYQNFSYICIKNILTKNLITRQQLKDTEDFTVKHDSKLFASDLKQYDIN